MAAELLKLRALPTPRWTFVVCLACATLALVLGAIFGTGTDEVVPGVGIELPTAIASIVLGAWVVGLEYGQQTMRRTLTAEPRRARVFAAKVGAAVIASAVLTLGLFAIAAIPYHLIADANDSAADFGNLATRALAALEGNATGAVVGASVALLTRSMAGGVTAALMFMLVLDTALGAIPSVGDYTIGTANLDIYDAIMGDGSDHLGRAILMSIVWMGGLALIGAARFRAADV